MLRQMNKVYYKAHNKPRGEELRETLLKSLLLNSKNLFLLLAN